MVEFYKLDYEESEIVYKECESEIVMKECYNNIFKVTQNFTNLFIEGTWKVAYGYHSVISDDLMARHCFIINENKRAIDPTIFSRSKYGKSEDEGRKYMAFKVFNFEEYIDALLEENGQPALYDYFYELEQSLHKGWAKENKVILMG